MEIKFNKVSYQCTNSDIYKKTILSNVDLEIQNNTITAIMGKSGSGKTTLIDMLLGLIKPTDGYIDLKNKKIGLVFQNPMEQFFLDTVEKELTFAVKHLNKKNNIQKHVLNSLQMVGLDESYLKRKLNELSNSERKKVAIASVLCINPKVLILDEPTINLDNESIEFLIKLLKLLKLKYNKTIIIVSKDGEFVHKIADKVVVLFEGKIVLDGTKYEVFTKDIEKYGLRKPKIIEFEQLARDKKKIRLLYRDEINDLMKDIYRYVK